MLLLDFSVQGLAGTLTDRKHAKIHGGVCKILLLLLRSMSLRERIRSFQLTPSSGNSHITLPQDLEKNRRRGITSCILCPRTNLLGFTVNTPGKDWAPTETTEQGHVSCVGHPNPKTYVRGPKPQALNRVTPQHILDEQPRNGLAALE